MDDKNLLQETIEILSEHNKTPYDVRWVGSIDGEYEITWLRFTQIANFEYDHGYGAQLIADDLVVVGDDWWLERHDYDGSEWWEYKELPIRKAETKPFAHLLSENGAGLAKLETDPKSRMSQ